MKTETDTEIMLRWHMNIINIYMWTKDWWT